MDEKLLRVAQALIGARPTPAGTIPTTQLPGFVQPGAAFNNARPPMAPQAPAMPPQTVAASHVAPPPGLLPMMQPAAQPSPAAAPAPAMPQPQGYTDEQRAAMDALVKRMEMETEMRSGRWANPWQAP